MKSSAPTVSVMMPAYNVEKYIGEAIESILNQTFQDFELLILDDGSTDSTFQIMQQYAQKNEKIKIYQNEKNEGLVITRNRLLELSQGKYLAILDSDDIALPDRLEKQVTFLKENPDYGLLGGCVEYFTDTEPNLKISKRLQESDKITSYLLFHNVFGQSTVMFRRELAALKYNPIYAASAEDYDLWVRMSWQTKTDNLPDILIRYRVHQNNISKLREKELLRNVRKIHQMQLERLGITPNDSELDIHKLLADQKQPVSSSEFEDALNWLEKLYVHNKEKNLYPRIPFKDELKVRLRELCLNAVYLGEKVAIQALAHSIAKTLFDKKTRLKLWFLAKSKGKDTGKIYPFLYQMYKKIV